MEEVVSRGVGARCACEQSGERDRVRGTTSWCCFETLQLWELDTVHYPLPWALRIVRRVQVCSRGRCEMWAYDHFARPMTVPSRSAPSSARATLSIVGFSPKKRCGTAQGALRMPRPVVWPSINGEVESARTVPIFVPPTVGLTPRLMTPRQGGRPTIRMVSALPPRPATHTGSRAALQPQARPPLSPPTPKAPSRSPTRMSRTARVSRPSAPAETAAASSSSPAGYISELHLHASTTTYTVVCAAPGLTRADLHHKVEHEQRILRVSNAAEPEERAVLAYALRTHLDVYEYPSLRAPVVDHKQRGDRIRGHAPVHFWIALANGAGWVRYEPSALEVLGRGPLKTHEASAPTGFARWVRLPPDTDLDSASAGMAKAGGFFAVRFKRLPPEVVEPVVKMVDTSNSSQWRIQEVQLSERDAQAQAEAL